MKTNTLLRAVGAIFSVIAVLHAMRLLFAWPAQIGTLVIPVWASGVGMIVAGYLAYQCLKK